MAQRLAFVAAQQRAVGMHDPPPRHATAPQRHDPADLPGTALPHVFGDVSVRHHVSGWDGFGGIENASREIADPGHAGAGLRWRFRRHPGQPSAECCWPGSGSPEFPWPELAWPELA
jgi:hypothetical protein